jgi:hypothetical protein
MTRFKKLLAFLHTRLLLVLVGVSCECLYFFYLERQFPLLSHYTELTDMGIINNYSHRGFLSFALVFSILFVLVCLAWWEARQFSDRATLWLILGFGGLFALTTIFVYPVAAIDMFIYIAQSLVLVHYHANPLITAPAQYAHDPLMGLAGGFITYSSPYGPLGVLIEAFPTLISGNNVLVNLLLLKALFSAILLVEAFLVYKILTRIAPPFALAGTLALAWNPYALFEYSANSHNDIVMMLFILLALWAVLEERPVLSLVMITASILIKYASLPLFPLFFAYQITRPAPWRKRLINSVWSPLSACLLFTLALFLPFWAGPKTFERLATQNQGYLASFSMFLNDFSAATISLEQAKQVGLVLFVVVFLYALFLSTRQLRGLLQGCFLVMFALLAFSVTNVQPWYLIWPFVLALLIPQVRVALIAFVLVYGAVMAELVHAYVWPWGGIQNPAIFTIMNSMTYLVIFLFPLLFLAGMQLKELFQARRHGYSGDVIAHKVQEVDS